MKINIKKLLALIILGMGFVILPNIKFDFTVEHNTFNNLKNSSIYYGSIQIDGSATTNTTYSGNWTWAVNQPWCYNDNGVYIIENLIINANTSPTGNGIYIENSKNVYFIIRNCTVYNAHFGIMIEAGIKLRNVNNGTITNNNCSNNLVYGISLLEDCNNNTISGNIASDNGYSGIILYGLAVNCQNNTISGNTANNNYYFGIRVSYNYNYNEIMGNTANGNNRDGIFLSGSSSHYPTNWNQITNNIIIKNQNHGIYIEPGCNNNSIYKNFFLENGIHAIDTGIDNKWNSTTIGNYWDNHSAPDVSPSDGIVDNPYINIGGNAGSIDYLPIAEDGAPRITINSPSSGSSYGKAIPSYNIEVIDSTPVEMWYTFDGGLKNYTFTQFTGTFDQSAWDALPEGSVNIIFYATDIAGNEAFEEVSIIKGIAPEIIVFIVVISIVGGIVVIAVAYLYLKKRKA